MNRLRRLLADLTHTGPGCDLPYQPRRGDAVEAWLRAQRSATTDWSDWNAVNDLLDDYRLHADTGTPLDQHVCEGCMAGDCQYLDQPTTAPF